MADLGLSFGPSLSGPAGATTAGIAGRIYSYLEIPNAPRPDVTMPLAQYPDIPSIRYKYQEEAPDMGRRIAALQQSELPADLLKERRGLRVRRARDRRRWGKRSRGARRVLATR